MDANTLLLELGKLAEKLEIELRFEALDTPGGLCRVKGKKILLVNENLEPSEQVEVIASELARQEDIDNVYVLPSIRKLIDERR
jgi:hypothetical protein